LSSVRKRGYLICGVNPGLAGFAYPDTGGHWRGFDVDFCRAIAAATLGDAKAVRFLPVSVEKRFRALESGQIDVLARNTSWTMERDASLGFDFPAVTYFDGQGFLVAKALKLTSAGELNQARICVQAGTASQANLADYFRAQGLTYREVLVADDAAARAKYQADGCDAFTADVSALASSRSIMNNPAAHEILPDVISKEPLGPVVRQADRLHITQIAAATRALIDKAQAGRLSYEDIDGGTFSISNLGMMGIEAFDAIINPPQGAILAVGGVNRVAVELDDGDFAFESRIQLSLSVDHRAIDGAAGAAFLQTLKGLIEDPESLFR
jgi:general L-amino acid transport system substrate-binding protein